jgi:hypothetical protein
MAKSARDKCIDEIVEASGRKREHVEGDLNDLFERARAYEGDGMSRDDAYARARDEKLQEIGEERALRRRAEILDARKRAALNRFD